MRQTQTHRSKDKPIDRGRQPGTKRQTETQRETELQRQRQGQGVGWIDRCSDGFAQSESILCLVGLYVSTLKRGGLGDNLNRSTRIRGQGFGKNVGGGDSKVSIIKLLHGGCSSAAYPPAGQHWPRFLFSFWSLLRMCMFKEFQT